MSEINLNKLKISELSVNEPNVSETSLNDLPELAFELILSYLSLADCIKARSVSRGWCLTIDRLRVNTLCFSNPPSCFISEKSRWISHKFAQNFIGSTKFEFFFPAFGQTILSSLKHLRLCRINLDAKNGPALAQALHSLGRLEQLDIIRFKYLCSGFNSGFELNLPMLNRIHFEGVFGIRQLTLDSPKLQTVIVECCCLNLRLNFVHAESVEKLIVNELDQVEVNKMKNLKSLYHDSTSIETAFLSDLEQMKEIHLVFGRCLRQLFELKQRYGRADLKIFLGGVLVINPDDPMIEESPIDRLSKSSSILADEIPFFDQLPYDDIQHAPRGLEIKLLKKFTYLTGISVWQPVQEIERFLGILSSLDNITSLEFNDDQPQQLFDRLPDHCPAILNLKIDRLPPNLDFLFKLKSLLDLKIDSSIDAEFIRKVFKQLEFLLELDFAYNNKKMTILVEHPKAYLVRVEEGKWNRAPNLDTAIRFIIMRALKKEEDEEDEEE